jgi:hypothetical protein
MKPYRLRPPADLQETGEFTMTSRPRTQAAPADARSTGGNGPGGTPPADADQNRYGTRRGMSRARKIGLGVVGLVILGSVAGYIGWEQSHPAIQGTVLKFTAQSDSVAVTFEVDKAASKTATCTLQALDTHGAVVGSVAVQIPAGRGTNVMSYTLSTTSTANTVEVASCQVTS